MKTGMCVRLWSRWTCFNPFMAQIEVSFVTPLDLLHIKKRSYKYYNLASPVKEPETDQLVLRISTDVLLRSRSTGRSVSRNCPNA